jgi:hypothetical protein
MTGIGWTFGGKAWPHLTQLVRSAKLKTLQDGQRMGLGLGGLHPPQYGLHDQHIDCFLGLGELRPSKLEEMPPCPHTKYKAIVVPIQ